MSEVLTNIVLILVFVLVGGVFAASEMALVSLRESQIKQLAAHRGSRGQTIARLTENPNRFLSAVQIGVTVSGFLSAAFGAATLAGSLAPVLVGWGLPAGAADTVALVSITIAISYVSIVLGELAAKRLALQRAEGVALMLAPLIDRIAWLARPLIWFLGVSTDVVVKVLGGDPKAGREEVSDEEIRAMVSGSTTLGDEERRIVDDVFAAGDRSLREVMLPRTEVDFMSGAIPVHKAVRELARAPHSRYPVIGSSADDILGFVHVRDLLDPQMASRSTPVEQLARPVLSLPGTVRVLHALSELRRSANHLAIVLDEYGGTAGIVTMEDLVEELVGDIRDEYDAPLAEGANRRGEHLVDGLSTLEEFGEQTGFVLPEGPYDTVAGYVMAQLGQLPAVGDSVTVAVSRVDGDAEGPTPLQLTVTELDGRRAAGVTVRRSDGEPLVLPAE